MLKHNEINLLAVFGLRRVEHCPPHFTVVDFDMQSDEKTITDWIYENLSGRFYLGGSYWHRTDNSMTCYSRVAFEIPGEASYFALIKDSLIESNKI
jgi:hypothetical protein